MPSMVLQAEVAGKSFAPLISWRESDDGEYDVRDLIGVMELFNVFDFPNNESRHPVAAYEKWSIPLEKFAQDFEQHRRNVQQSKYHRLRPILIEALRLHDIIRHDFRRIHNDHGGQAGKLKILEEASARRKQFEFPFSGSPSSRYRLTKGALYPILAAFRNCVETGRHEQARWIGGFETVTEVWEEAGPELVAETMQAIKDHGSNPDVIGKNRGVWSNMHKTLELRMLRRELKRRRA